MGRMERVNQQMRRELSEIIQQEIQDPRVEFVSVTHVEVSPDLHYARVSISALGDAKKGEDALTALNNARRYIRRLIGERVRIRYIPELDFVYDYSIQYGAKIEETLKEIHDERKENTKGAEGQ